MTLEIVRVERDCQHNRMVRQGEAKTVIYDFRVLISRRDVAIFKRQSVGVSSYELLDPDGNSIGGEFPIVAREQAEFRRVFERAYFDGLIPNEEQLSCRRGDKAACLRLASPDLLRAAELVLSSFGYAPGQGPEWYEATRKAVAKANGVSV